MSANACRAFSLAVILTEMGTYYLKTWAAVTLCRKAGVGADSVKKKEGGKEKFKEL